MKKIETCLKDCYILEPDKFGDDRGYFSPYFIKKNLDDIGFQNVVQANRSKSAKGVVRGLHFQKDPKCQAKIVEVIKGSAIDIVVDMREDSPSYGKHVTVKLTDENNRQLFVPRGFAHGFISLEASLSGTTLYISGWKINQFDNKYSNSHKRAENCYFALDSVYEILNSDK